MVGTAIARELSRYQLDCVLVDAAADVGTGTTKANTAILHTGFDAVPGSLEGRLLRRGSVLLRDYAARAGIPVERTGALLDRLGRRAGGRPPRDRGKGDGKREPGRPPGLASRAVPPRAAPRARRAGRRWRSRTRASSARGPRRSPTRPRRSRRRRLLLSTRVTGVSGDRAGLRQRPRAGDVARRAPVPLAGQRRRAGKRPDRPDARRRRVHDPPRRGELIVFDKLARPLVGSILLPVPTAQTKGVLVAPTVYGNVLLGPTAEDIDDPSDTATTAAGLASLLAAGRRDHPDLLRRGGHRDLCRAAGRDRAPRLPDRCRPAAPRTPASPASGPPACRRRSGSPNTSPTCSARPACRCASAAAARPPPPRMPYIGEAGLRPYQDAARIEADGELRPARLPLRAGQPRRDHGTRWPARCRPPTSTGCAADARAQRPLPGLLLRGDGHRPARRRPRSRAVTVDVLVVGAGPAASRPRSSCAGSAPARCSSSTGSSRPAASRGTARTPATGSVTCAGC